MDDYLVQFFAAGEIDTDDRAKADLEVRGWRLARQGRSARLFVREEVMVRDTARGWIVGAVFMRGTGQPAAPAILPSPETSLDAFCARLSRHYWGRYVAIFPQDQAVFRDPSGHLDALTWATPEGYAASSTLDETLPDAVLPTALAIDWSAIATIAGPAAMTHDRLGLSGVSSVAPGVLRALASSRVHREIWTPGDFARAPHGSYLASRTAVAQAVEEALIAETATGQPLLAEISGGLDSAIVASTLTRVGAATRTRFVHFHTPDPAGDERLFARDVATKLGVPLQEITKPELLLDMAVLDRMPVGARASVNAIDRHYDTTMAGLADETAAGSILTGQGGDMVFFQSPSPRVVGELWGRWARFPRADPLWRQLEAAARWNRRSVWSLIGEAGREAWAARRRDPDPGVHPWLARAVAPAKTRQIQSLVRAQVFHGASTRGRYARLVHPLLHQPVLEAVLAAPIIDLARGGRGRSLARDAFVTQLPRSVVERRSKGDLTAYYGRMVLRSLPTLTPFLLEGRLTQARILDRGQVERMLDPDRLIHEGDYPKLFETIALETYVRYWDGRVASRAAAGPGTGPGTGDARRSASQGMTSS